MSKAIELYNNATFTVVTDERNPDKSEIWATQKEMAKAFGVNVPTVSKHIKDVLQSGELQEVAVVSKMETTASDGKKYKTNFYNLKMIIAVGFRIESGLGIKFRQWANDVLEKYSTQGCAIDLNAMANGYKKSELFALLAEASKRFEEQEQKLLEQAKTVIEADTIKGTKHTKDECVLLDMYNAGHIGVIPTII